jgi:hypothetical protein
MVAVLHHYRARGRRWILDTLIALASATVALAVVVLIDSRAGSQMAPLLQDGARSASSLAAQTRSETVTLVRTGWEMAQLHAPLMTFVAIGTLLMLFMIRMK